MAKFFDALDQQHTDFIEAQPMFFVASAPAHGGHVNVSPKGGETFRVLSPNRACYLDLTGSGNETAAHVLQNGRLTVMFCSFARMAQIMRLFGTGRTFGKGTAGFNELSKRFPDYVGARQIVTLDIETVQTSCGYQVPVMDFVAERQTLTKWAEQKGPDGLAAYRAENNRLSIDGLPTGLIGDER